MAKDNIGGIISSTIGAAFGTLSSVAGVWMVDQTSLGSAGSGLSDTVADSREDPELAAALSFGFGVGGSSSSPQEYIVVTLADNKPCTKVEKNAKQLYDKYDHNHTKSKDEGASLVILDDDAKEVVDDIIEKSNSRAELISCLNTLQKIVSDVPNIKDKTKDIEAPVTKEAKVKKI